MRKIILILLSIVFISTASAQWNPWSYYNETKIAVITVPYVYNAETLAWKARVVARGGNVDTIQLRILDNFVKNIQNAGLRNYFLRFNPLYGSDLTATYIPLYRDTSFKETYLGFANDSNFNFVAADYNDALGLGNTNTSKYFDTGFNPNNISFLTNVNYGIAFNQTSAGSDAGLMGAFSGGVTQSYVSVVQAGGLVFNAWLISGERSVALGTAYDNRGLWHFQKTGVANTSQIIHKGFSKDSFNGFSSANKPNTNYHIFNAIYNGSQIGYYSKKLNGYALLKTLTDAQADTLNTIWSNYTAYRYLKDNTIFITDGNSMTYGTASVNYGLQFALNTGYEGFTNKGLAGATIHTLNARYETTIAPLYDATKRMNILCIWEYCNAAMAGSDSASILTQFRQYYQKAKATGFKVIAFTNIPFYPPAGYESNDALYETRRQQVNYAFRNNTSLYCDALCDIASDSRLGDKGDESDLTYRNPDKIHMNERGDHVIMTWFANTLIKLN